MTVTNLMNANTETHHSSSPTCCIIAYSKVWEGECSGCQVVTVQMPLFAQFKNNMQLWKLYLVVMIPLKKSIEKESLPQRSQISHRFVVLQCVLHTSCAYGVCTNVQPTPNQGKNISWAPWVGTSSVKCLSQFLLWSPFQGFITQL